MRINFLKETGKTAARGTAVLLIGAGMAAAQQQVNLTAARTNVTLPDGSLVPMWGYSCGSAVSGSTATCAALNPNAPVTAPAITPATPGWSPVVITIPSGQDLTISLTNNLTVPTSLTIVGQLGGGLGTPVAGQVVDHSNPQGTTWPIANAGPTFTPPAQGQRVQSFGTEVSAGGGNQLLTWQKPRPGTYLIESGTHPSIQGSMGLYGILVVTSAPTAGTSPALGCAYPGASANACAISYSAEVPLLFSEIDKVQNVAVDTAVDTTGFSEYTVWTGGPNGCGAHFTCYPPTVNYSPTYYLINGVAFDKTSPGASLFSALPAPGASGNVLVRLVNAGLRMHVPAIVGSQTGTPAKTGLSLIAEDGNLLPGIARIQNEVFLAAGKTYDVMINVPTGSSALPIYDRELSLSSGAVNRDAGMLAYIGVNGAGLPSAGGLGAAVARPDVYTALVAGQSLTVADPSKGLIANDTNVYGVTLLTQAVNGTVSLNADGTYVYTPLSGSTATTDSFSYCANGTVIPPLTGSCSSGITATVTLSPTNIADSGITCTPGTFNSNVATFLAVKTPGVLANCTDGANLPLTVATSTVTATGMTVLPNVNGGFTAVAPAAGTYTFTFQAKNSLGTLSPATTVTVFFPQGSNLQVTVLDGSDKKTVITDYRWIIEEDRTFYVDPICAQAQGQATLPSNCPRNPVNFGTNFHISAVPVIATGCTGAESCADEQTVLGQAVTPQARSYPSDVALDPTKRYYISVLPGDAAQPFIAGYAGAPDCTGASGGVCGHGMGGAPIPTVLNGTHSGQTVTVLTEPSPFPPATLSVFVFEDDYPLNGEHDAGGGIDVLSPNEPGLGGFQITLQDNAGGTGDATGNPTYDMFNMPLSNSLAGTIDPTTKMDACPISTQVSATSQGGDSSQNGIVGMIVTCPKYESDGKTLSPLAGQAVVKNLYPGRYGVIANPGADRIGRGEEWVQTNTLDGQKAHDSFMRIGEPGYFQEFGPAGYHVTIGFANPKIITDRGKALCNASGADCAHEVKGHVTTARMSRTPDERLYGSGDHTAYSFTQCYVSIGDPDGADFGFSKCDNNGNFDFPSGTVPAGNWKITTFDQWNDQVVDGITTAVGMCNPGTTTNCKSVVDMGEVAVHQWQANLYTRTFLDSDYSGVSNDQKTGLTLVATNIRFRDGSYSNFNTTDLNGYATFNEVFPLFNWYVVESDATRYKNTGTHVVYDTGGADDGTSPNGTPCNSSTTATKPCGSSTIADHLANTYEANPLPPALSVPGAVYCSDADCTGASIAGGPANSSTSNHSSGRIDPGWVDSYGWQGYSGQNNFLEFGKKPFAEGENGGIRGHVVYASTRPFDDPQLLLQLSWEPLIPHVRVNLYKKGIATDGITETLTLVDHTETSSFDDWAQGFRSDGIPNMNCPGQGTDTSSPVADPYFWFTLKGQPQWLDVYNSQHGGPAPTTLPNGSQFKCYDGMHNWNQLQPAPYDGMYKFPSITSIDPTTGKPAGTNCTGCTTNPDTTDPYRVGASMLPDGKYVVEVVVPQGYELVKEEDKNILIGDNFIAPVTQQFGGLSNIFILPDQAEINAHYNANNSLDTTTSQGRVSDLPSHESDTGSDESFWPCVGENRVVPDFISLFPGSAEVAPFAGATRPLCDRKEVSLDDQTTALAKFYIFTPTHKAAHFTGQITDDFAAEFDPFSPAFGEKFAPAYLPVGIKDWAGNEVNRVYADQWGVYNGLNYSTWEVNPPNPTGYGPTMMVTCMNDPGPIPDPNNPGQMIADPLNQSGYSNFCYELPFMPGQTGYFDTPVVPTSAFAGDYNTPDCAYPDATPAVSEVDGDGVGPWVSAANRPITITALGNQNVDSYLYSGPSATAAPYNQQRTPRHYGFLARCTAPTAGSTTCNTASSVMIGGVAATIVNWSDTSITVNVPNGVPACSVQQQAQYGGSNAECGQLVITAGNGKQSIDTVTVTVGGKTPTHVSASQTIQSAIDAAQPGDLIIIDPTCNAATGSVSCSSAGVTTKTNAAHAEMLLMWKPVRLQGVGAASSLIDANPHPAGKLDPWRRQVVCLFGLALNGTPITGTNQYDSSGAFSCDSHMQFSVDRLPLEATVGWDATLNGNLAEQLIEPTIMGAYEGAGITILGKGVKFPAGSDPFASDVFPTGTSLLTTNDCGLNTVSAHNPYPSNFLCNPSSIDGLTIKNSSQGGGGILAHGWTHNLQIANNRVLNNQGTLSGGITIGQGEHPDAYLVGGAATATVPGSCILNTFRSPTNMALPYCFDRDVNVHNNAVVQNSSLGDELFSSTPAGAGGVTFCNGSDYYKFNYNWVCGNMSTGDGAGVAQIGYSYDGDIEHNTILFNQSTNPTITTNGGGLLIMGAPDQDPPCALLTDQDCLSAPGTITPSDGTGPGLVINANLILGNSADSGSGGGLRLQHINGNDVLNFPRGNASVVWPSIPGHAAQPSFQSRTPWNAVQVTNNIIANNVAGWDGGGVSLQDALATDLINNTVVSNNSTASSGVLFQSLFAPLASTPGVNCTANNGANSCPQVAGLVSVTNSAVLVANINQLPGGAGSVRCPTDHGTSGSCTKYSVPLLYNDVFWKNRSVMIGVGGLAGGMTNQNNQVTVYNSPFGGTIATAAASQGSTGACDDPNASYWDIGVRGAQGPGDQSSGSLAPIYSVLTNTGAQSEVGSGSNDLLAPGSLVGGIYCNGARVPVEAVTSLALKYPGWQVPPGTNESNGLPAPPFTLQPAATVDEGNNWVNLRWGPLAMNVTNASGNPVFTFNPSLVGTSPAVNYVPIASTAGSAAPNTDFYGNPRKQSGNPVDVGAIEYQAPNFAILAVAPTTLAFPNTLAGTTSAAQTLTLSNTGGAAATGISVVVTAPFARPAGLAGGSCAATLAAGSTCTINVAFSPATAVASTGTVTITGSVAVTGSPVSLTGTGMAATHTATVSPSPLAFGVWPTGVASAAQTVTVTNTGNSPLAGGIFTIGGGTPQPFTHSGGSCGATLAVGASCTYNVVFTPATAVAFSRTLTVAYTGATITGSPVTLTGTGGAHPAVTILPNPLTITLPSGAGNITGTGTATFTNTAAPGGANVTVSNITTTGGSLFTYFFNVGVLAGADNCTGATIAPGASCTVAVRFTNVGSARGTTRTGTLRFTDSGAASPQTITLNGFATR